MKRSSHKKKRHQVSLLLALSVLGVMLACLGGMLIREHLIIAELSDDFGNRTDKILHQYRKLAETYILPLADDQELTDHQREVCENLNLLYWKIRSDLTAKERLQAIEEMQLAVRSLLLATPRNSPLASRPLFQGLKRRTAGLLHEVEWRE